MGFGRQDGGHLSRPLEKEASDRVYADDCAACIAIVARGYGDVNCAGACGFGAARMLRAAAASRATNAR